MISEFFGSSEEGRGQSQKANRIRNILLKSTDKEMKEKNNFFPLKEKETMENDFKVEFQEFFTSLSDLSGKRENCHLASTNTKTTTANTQESNEGINSIGLSSANRSRIKKIEGSFYLLSLMEELMKKKVTRNLKNSICSTYTPNRQKNVSKETSRTCKKHKTFSSKLRLFEK